MSSLYINKIAGAILSVLFLLTTAQAASFDCLKALSHVEKIVCGNDELSKLDDSLSAAYIRARKLTSDKKGLVRKQRQWLKYERGVCRNVECIKWAYETRIMELERLSAKNSNGPKKSNVEIILSTKLPEAAKRGSIQQIKTQLEKGADVNSRDKGGETALSHAVGFDDADTVRYLKAHGAKSPAAVIDAEQRKNAVDEKSGAPLPGRSMVSFCKEIGKMNEKEAIDEYVPESVSITIGRDPRASEYLDVDIDGDGISDKVIYSYGSGESLLEIQLSSGGEYDINVAGFTKIVRMEERYYALVSYVEKNKQPDGLLEVIKHGERLYRLAKHGAVLVCGIEDLENPHD